MKVTEVNEKGKPETSLSPSSMEKREHRKKARIRRAQIAIAALLIFVLSSLMALNMNEQNTLALVHPLETIQHFLRGDRELSAPSSGGREEKSQTVRITDPENIDEALRLMPQLYIPEYLPEGWEMKSLEVTKKADGVGLAIFSYINTNNMITIDEFYGINLINDLNTSEKIEISGRSYYYHENEDTGEGVLIFLEKENLIQINSNSFLEKDEMLRIAEKMEQRQMPSKK